MVIYRWTEIIFEYTFFYGADFLIKVLWNNKIPLIKSAEERMKYFIPIGIEIRWHTYNRLIKGNE